VASSTPTFDIGTGPLLANIDGFALAKLAP
jgi:hypothetical protein